MSDSCNQHLYELAQLNLAKLKYPSDSPEVAEFMNSLVPINLLAEASDGFVWRLKDDTGHAMSFAFDDMTLPNMSVWRDRDALFKYVYNSGHTHYLGRRKEWFEMPSEAHMVLWWVSKGHTPSLEEAMERLEHLKKHGPSAYAFTFKQHFGPESASPV